MGQPTQTVANSLKPYGLVYDLVTNLKVPVNWAINPAKTTFRLDPGDPIPIDFTATITTGTKSYSGGSFIIDAGFLTPAVIADINTWKAQGVVVDQLAAPLTTEVYGQISSFPRAVLDLQNGKLAVPYYANAGVPASSYQIGNPTNLDHCDDVYILPHADPDQWPAEWKQALYDFVNSGGGLWAGCHSVSVLEDLIINGTTQLNFLSNGLVPFGSHSNGTPPYSYNSSAANDPVMQIMNRLDAATQNGSEQIFVPTTLDWRSTTTVAVFDPDHPNNPPDGTSPFNKAAVIAYGNAFGDPTKGLVMYEGGHSLAGNAAANIAAQRAFFNFLLTEGLIKAPQPTVNIPTITAGQSATLTATISGGSGSYSYQWVSASGGVFSKPAGTWNIGDPPITTQYLMTGAKDTIRLLVTDTCNRQGLFAANLADPPPTIDLDANNSSGATAADFQGYFAAGATVAAADTDTLITDNGTTIHSAVIKLTTRPDGAAETLLIDETLAASFGINVASDGNGGFLLSGTATLADYQAVIASLQYVNALAFPNSTDRVIAVTVNDGISNSNTAISRLSFLGGSVTTVNKQLYLSDPGQGMDRVDPVATGDTTTSSVAVVPVVSNNSTGMATWTNEARKNLEYRPWLLTGYGTQGNTVTNGSKYITMTSAASAKRNEAIVVGVTDDRHVSGSIWNGSTWTPIAINVGGTTTQNLGHPSQKQWWSAAVDYETSSGRAVLVWNSGSTLNYSIWNGTAWTPAASIPAYTGVEPRQIRLAANPLAGSNEMVLVVTDTNEVDRALVWSGSTWGNQIQLDNNTGHNFTDVNVVYEQSGRAMVVFASGTTGAVGYQLWNGSAWGAPATLTNPAGTNNYAQWTVVAADPNSNLIVLGVETNGQDAWMNVWNGSTWGTSTLGVSDTVNNVNNLEIAVAFESESGDALAVYENNENTNTTELQFRSFTGGAWSAGTNFGSFANHETEAITLNSNPYSDQIQLLVNDDAKILRSDLWSGSSFAAPIQLEANTGTTAGQPFSFFWDRYVPGAVTSTTTFTQTTAMTSPFVMPTGSAVKVTTYIQLTSGTLLASPNLAVRLGQGGSPLLTISPPPTVTPLGGNFYKLEWTGSMPSNTTVPTGGQISLTLIDFDSTYAFNVLYDSNTYPSQVQVATATGIDVSALGVYGVPFPAGTPLTTTVAGQPAFVRFTLSDPFGAADITSADLVIKNSTGGTVVSTTLTDANVVASTPGSKTYEFVWTPLAGDTFTITVTAHEGTEGVTATGQTTISATASPDLVVAKSDGGASVNAGGSVSYTINYSNVGLANATGVVITESLPAGATFNAAGSAPGWVALGAGEFRFAVGNLAAGASGSVVFAVTVPTPVSAALEQLDNTVQIADDGTHGADTNAANNAGVDSTTVNAAPDLVVTKTDGGTSTLASGIVLYQITYTNIGTQNADGVVITETLPANTIFNSTYSFGEWDDEGGGVFTLIVGDLPVGVSGTVTFAVNVNSPLPGGVTQIANTVLIADSGDGGPDLNPANNTATDTTPIANNPQADLQITKTNNVTGVQPGGVVAYTITVTNAGPSAVTGATFTDNVPPSLTGVSYTTAVSGGAVVTPVSGSGNSISGSLNVPVGGTVIYTVTGTLNPNSTGTLTNVATILPPAGILDPNTGNDTAVDSDPIVPVSNLSLNKSFTFTDLDGSGTLTPGDQIVFALTVTNSGPNAALNVSIEDLLPNGYAYVSDDAAGGGTYAAGTGLWTLGTTLGATAPNNTAVLHITAIVGPGGTYTNEAQVHGSGSFDPDSTPDNDVPTEDDFATVTPVVQPKSDLSLDKTMALSSDLDSNGILSIGDRVTFTLTLNNLGPNDAASVHVADPLPAGYSFFSATASQGTYTSATGDWNVGAVSVLSTPTLSIVATVVGGSPAGAYTNYAQVSAAGGFDPDSTPGNNSTAEDDDANVTPPIADVSLTKTAALSPGGDLDGSVSLTVGDQVVFTLTVTNAGPDFATGVQVLDLLANGYTYEGDDSPGTYDPVTGLWNVGALAPGATATLNITATVNPTGTYTNTAQVTASQHFDPDSTPNNNVPSEDDQASITLTPGAAAQAPVAVNDSSLHNPPGPVTLNVTNNDTDPNLDLAVNTVDLNPGLAGQQTTLVVAGQGTWSVDTSGNVTFTPEAGFTSDPTSITYTVQDAGGQTSNQATITIDYVPVATNDSSSGNTTGTAVTVPVLGNDTTGDTPVAATVQIVGTPAPGVSLVVSGEGTWSVNTTTGAITFTPAPGFAGDPTPIQYTVQDNDGNTSNPATVTVDYVQFPPVAVNDSSLNNAPGPVTLNVTANDTDPNNDLDPGTVDLDPSTPGRQTTFIVSGEGFWQADSTGNVTYFPNVGFTPDPAPISYTVQDKTGLPSNAASITVTYVSQADLSITKTDGQTSAVPGTPTTYTIVVSNQGPSAVNNVLVVDTFPAVLTGVTWTSVGSAGVVGNDASGSGNINDTVTLIPLGGTVTYTVTGTIDPAATGTLTNTATVSPPAGVTDPDPSDNSATDTDTLTPQADLSITKTDSVTSVVPGTPNTYTIVVSNLGPSAVSGASVSDPLPAGVTAATWTATASSGGGSVTGPSSGFGALATTVDLPVNASVTFTFTVLVSPSATGSLSNTATVSPPAGVTDPNPTNNSASDTDTLTPSADLSVTKTDGVLAAAPGTSTTYTIVVSNDGPSTAVNQAVTDVFPSAITAVSWTAVASAGSSVAAASGSGNINTTVTLLPGGTVTFTAIAQISPSATGSLTNTATVAVPPGDTTPGNNSATDTDSLTPLAGLLITKDDGQTTAVPGTSTSYTITVTNAGPNAVTGAALSDPLPAGVTAASWAFGGATGGGTVSGPTTGSGALATTINLPVGATITFTFTVQIDPSATGSLVNTATATPPGGTPTGVTDTDTLTPQADLSITKTDGQTSAVPGTPTTYTIVVSNQGPSTVSSLTLTDAVPAALLSPSFGAPSAGSYDPATGLWTGLSLAQGQSVSITLTGTINPAATGILTNSAHVSPPAGVTDPDPTDNNASDTDTLTPSADLSITKTDGQTSDIPGTTTTYTIVVTNAGPSAATNVLVIDAFPAALTGVSWTSVGSAGVVGNDASGSGNINDTVTFIPVGGTVTYTLTGTIDPAATGTLSNTATVIGANDTNNANNSATDTTALGTGSIAWEKRTTVAPFPLQGGATFEISPDPTDGIGTLVVSDNVNDADPINGSFLVTGARPGTYTITETAAPAGYYLDPDPTRVITVGPGENAVVGTQGIDDPANLGEEADFHNRPKTIVIPPDKSNCSLPYIHVVNAVTGELVTRFLAYEIDYLGGVRVATGDLTGDGIAEIITAPGRSHTPLVKIWDQNGNLLTSFLAFSSSFIGGVDIAVGDVNGDGLNDIAAAQSFLGNQVTVFRNTTVLPATTPTFTKLGSFSPFGSFQGGSTVELADMGTAVTINNVKQLDQTSFDGRAEVIVGTKAGIAPAVKIFSYFGAATTPSLVKTFNPFIPAFHGGMSLDVARINADLVPDIIVGAGNGGASKVQILDGISGAVIGGFFAFTDPSDSPFAPIDVAAQDENGDGIADVIFVAQGSDGTAEEIRKFNAQTGAFISSITEAQFDSTFNGQPIDDFCGGYFVATLEDRPLPVIEVQIASTGFTASLLPYGPTYFGGVSVATGDLNGDGIEEIVTGPERNFAPWVRIFDQAGNMLHQFLAYASTYKGGVDVAVGDVNGDGKLDIATSMLSGGSQVKTFKNVIPLAAAVLPKTSFSAHSSFYPFGSSFKGGAVVELADLGKAVTVGSVKKLDSTRFDGRAEVVVANQAGLRSTVKAFSYFGTSTTATLVRTFLPFDNAFRGGVALDVARIDGDLVPDIIVGAGKGGASKVHVLNGVTGGVISAFQAFTSQDTPNYNARLDVEAQDADQDGIAEFLLAARDFDGKSREIRRFYSLSGELVDSFFQNYSSI